MKQNKMLLMMVGFILFLLFFISVGNTEEKDDRWVLYGTSKNGDHSYYDKNSMKRVSKNIIKVWDKTKYSKITKENKIEELRKDKKSIGGLENLDYGLILHEVDCVNYTVKGISMVEYSDDEKILYQYNLQDPETTHILPRSKGEVLLNTICPK